MGRELIRGTRLPLTVTFVSVCLAAVADGWNAAAWLVVAAIWLAATVVDAAAVGMRWQRRWGGGR